MGSIAFYVLICLFIVFFSVKVEKNIHEKFFVCMLILTLTLVAGLRHQSVGIDTPGYVSLISQLRDGYHIRLNNISEQGFIALSYVIVNISDKYTLALIVYGFITNALIVLRLYDYKRKISFTWAVFMYYMLFYFATFNTIRQWLAMAIVFYGTRYISDNIKSIIKYVIFVLLAVLMHTTALFAIFMIPLYYISLPSKDIQVQIKKIVMSIIISIASIAMYITFESKYGKYISSTVYGDVSWGYIALALFCCFVILYDSDWAIIVRMNYDKNSYGGVSRVTYETLTFFVGILLTLMVYITRYADRLGQYFLMFELIVLPYYIKKKKTRMITCVFVLLLCVYLRYSSFTSSGYGEVPYIPFWK